MIRLLLFIFIITNMSYSYENWTFIDTVYKYRKVFQDLYKNPPIASVESLLRNKITYTSSLWDDFNLIGEDADISLFYAHKEEIVRSFKIDLNTYKLYNVPIYIDIILYLIKDNVLDINFLYDIPSDIIIKNKKKIKELITYKINNGKLPDSHIGFAKLAVLAKLDSVYNYKIIPSGVIDYFNVLIGKEIDGKEKIKKISFDNAAKLLETSKICSPGTRLEIEKYIKTTEKKYVYDYVFGYNTKDVLYKFYNFYRSHYIGSSDIDAEYIRFLNDTNIIAELAANINNFPENYHHDRGYVLPHFMNIFSVLRLTYSDFNDIEQKKSYSIFHTYDMYETFYKPEKNNNKPFKEFYSQNYIYYMEQYEKWLKKKFNRILVRKPNPDDIVDNRRTINQ